MKRLWQKIRIRIIQLLSGKDLAVVTNITAVGMIYPQGDYMLISSNFIMGSKHGICTDLKEIETIHHKTVVDI